MVAIDLTGPAAIFTAAFRILEERFLGLPGAPAGGTIDIVGLLWQPIPGWQTRANGSGARAKWADRAI
ncbi:hypothetical protein ACI4B7_28835, partial [Klebsiella pneumoniae]|uniref:hypothetical protein n=1 Tax=Klebsiella pneumoniae TaxID=573 RepID=UPI00385464A3